MQIARFHRRRFAHLSTPLERLDRLTAELGGPTLWIKRDDCTDLGLGGNETRKQEFPAADAEAQCAGALGTAARPALRALPARASARCRHRPVYSGKGMEGLIDPVRKGALRKDENVVSQHTGGQVGLFAYRMALESASDD